MTWKVLSAATLLALGSLAHAADIERREIGNQILENVHDASPAQREELQRYVNSRSAIVESIDDDGSLLITTRFGQTAQLHRVRQPGGSRTQLTFFDEPVSSALMVPNSNRILFSKDHGGDEWFQLYLQDQAGRRVQLTEEGTRNTDAVVSADGRLAAWSRAVKGAGDTDLMIADLSDPGGRRVVTHQEGTVSALDISDDGTKILMGRFISVGESRRWVLDIKSGALTELNPAAGKISYVGGRFAADGKNIYLLSNQDADVHRLVEMEIATSRQRVLSPASRWDVESFELARDRRTIATVTNEDGYSRLAMYDVAQGRKLPTPKLPDGVILSARFGGAAGHLAISLATPVSPSDAWTIDPASGKATRWTWSEIGDLAPSSLVTPRLVHYSSFDGRQIPAFLYRPATAPARAPVVIEIHGGPEGQSLPLFNPRIQIYAGLVNAVVITPNVRGSTGYGQAYADLDNGMKREDSVKDIGALLDWIAMQPDLDPSRVIVIGGSYGGYMSLATMTHYSDRLLGGIELFGISNFISFLERTEAYRRDLRRVEYGDERDPEMRTFMERIAPINNIGNVNKPMLVMQGWNDPRVPKNESDQIVAALRGKGLDIWYVQFKDEGHGFRKKPNIDREREVEVTFMRHLLGLDSSGPQ